MVKVLKKTKKNKKPLEMQNEDKKNSIYLIDY